jgi:hypothetical protein
MPLIRTNLFSVAANKVLAKIATIVSQAVCCDR